MAADEFRLSDDAENDLAIGEGDLADREALGLFHEYRGEPGGGNLPYLHGDADGLGVGGIHPQHGGVIIVDAPQAVAGGGSGLPQEGGAGIEQVFSSGRPRMRVPLTASLTESMVVLLCFLYLGDSSDWQLECERALRDESMGFPLPQRQAPCCRGLRNTGHRFRTE